MASESDSDEDHCKKAEPVSNVGMKPEMPVATMPGFGFEYRPGCRTRFPEVQVETNETEEAAAFRVGAERRVAGNEAFKDGSVWGAQQAADAWSQGLLALERAKNLRKYRKARIEGGTSTEDDDAVQALENLDDAEERAYYAEAAIAACGGDLEVASDGTKPSEPTRRCRRVPTEAGVKELQITLRLNLAQALLKLRKFEECMTHCDVALALDPTSTKALWRKAKAVWGVRNPGEAREALTRLLELDPGNVAAVAMLREIDAEEARKLARRRGADARQAAHLAVEAARSCDNRLAAASAAGGAAGSTDVAGLACVEDDDDDDDDELEGAAPTAEAMLRAIEAIGRTVCCRRRKLKPQ
eukprot:TRINITY_DN1329_c0_g1_i1.p1 TRINITY_DN1329_c0_g1~~TRINITY_DN1329_c0_g1_i1.p1  ORF type:complete len:357 (+),score=82.88 TRINITY_DN1329_c0_g1_i1:101-1171(+)